MSSLIEIIEPTAPATRHGIDYLARAFENPANLISTAMQLLDGIQFDTLVGTGLSGALVVPTLARALGRHWMIIRKADDTSHAIQQGNGRAVGTLGSRWLFVDDLICSGNTREIVKDVIAALGEETAYIGTYLYGVGEWSLTGFYAAELEV
jgi:adenine/guanine phosphoribosyltransferase-like PRPP-binding protein